MIELTGRRRTGRHGGGRGRGTAIRLQRSSTSGAERSGQGRGGTHRLLGSRIILYGCTDDPQRLHFHVVRGRGEQALQRLPHAELFEIFTNGPRIFHIGVRVRVRCPGPVVQGVSKSDKADERQQHACVTIRIVDVLDELGII
jgi:hypothetical protein